MSARYWLALSAGLCAVALAGQPPPLPAPPPPSSSEAPGAAAPDDGFIEFLGADDVGDAAWWEFLKKSAPRKDQPPGPPPQDAKQ